MHYLFPHVKSPQQKITKKNGFDQEEHEEIYINTLQKYKRKNEKKTAHVA